MFLSWTSLLLMLDGVQAFVTFRSATLTMDSAKSSSSRLFVQQWQPPGNNNNINIQNDNIMKLGEMEDPYIDLGEQRYFDGTKPDSALNLAAQNFLRQGATIVDQFLETIRIRPKDPYTPPECLQLSLSNRAVAEAERRREAAGGRIDAHPISRALYKGGCFFLDGLFDERPIQRFWFLEIIARIVSRSKKNRFLMELLGYDADHRNLLPSPALFLLRFYASIV